MSRILALPLSLQATVVILSDVRTIVRKIAQSIQNDCKNKLTSQQSMQANFVARIIRCYKQKQKTKVE